MRAIFRRLLFLNFPKIDDGPNMEKGIMNMTPTGVPQK
jgi:hypothetical protein